MEWSQAITTKRFGLEDYHDPDRQDRTEFQRDYDRLVFSPSFRRLQNKTQVFPLPGNIFVHNRLTHSLEVSSVGRSLAANAARLLQGRHSAADDRAMLQIGDIVSAACLAHDMGNPPFGHSGEKAIASYFSEGEGMELKSQYAVGDAEWADITLFDGNANAFRLLTHQFEGHRPGGFVMTYSTLASVVKYPFEAALIAPGGKQKFGFFQDDKDSYLKIAGELGMKQGKDGKFARHPLVYLVEAADDICYEIMDIEDAHKLRLLTTSETIELLLGFFSDERKERRMQHMSQIADENEKIAYLRSCVVGVLVDECVNAFADAEGQILNGDFHLSLVKSMSPQVLSAYKQCEKVSVERIYKSQPVVDIEIAGFNIIYTLIDRLIKATFHPSKAYSEQLLRRAPAQYGLKEESYTPYKKIMAVLDYVSSMTDIYALDLYQKITGMSLPTL